MYAAITKGDTTAHCVYKPSRGERPLWDFPDGTLAFREVAAFAVSAATGWDVVPPTVLRDGPLGEGMVQLWIDTDIDVDLVELVNEDHPALRRMAVFDAVVNNADRKGGHLLPVPGGHVYGVDHGVTFNEEEKLRTLLWGWRGRRFAAEELAVLDALRTDLTGGELGETLRTLLSGPEVAATVGRVERLLATKRFPYPSADWPAVPWPPF
ncbi:MAG: hypothetical protein QOE45_2123 [Frankiaceae bacterium]|nr:hypothetical protein [Frankiaceae bacterium]